MGKLLPVQIFTANQLVYLYICITLLNLFFTQPHQIHSDFQVN